MDPALMQMFDLEGKVALVTGGSSGLGVAFARGLARAGADVVVTARRQELLDSVAADLRQYGHRAEGFSCDITDEAAFEALFDRVVQEFGHIDILVNNAGYTDRSAQRHDMASPRRIRSVIELDLMATVMGCKHAATRMLPNGGGVIINVSSILGRVGSEFRAASYHAAKAGVDGLTRVLALEYAREGIRVNAIAPSYFAGTEMMDQVFEATPGTKVQAETRTPMGRLGTPEDLEAAVVFLASGGGAVHHRSHTLCRRRLDGRWWFPSASAAVGERAGPSDCAVGESSQTADSSRTSWPGAHRIHDARRLHRHLTPPHRPADHLPQAADRRA